MFIATAEALDGEMIWAYASMGKPVLVSTGTLNESEVRELRQQISSSGMPDVSLLYCVSSYPAPNHQMNLALLRGGQYVGLSDHSRHVQTGALAVAAGAQVIETHVRCEGQDPLLPDYPHAFEPEEFASYVALIRDAEVLMGDGGAKRVQECEQEMAGYRVEPQGVAEVQKT